MKHIAGSFYYVRSKAELDKAWEHYKGNKEYFLMTEYPEAYPCTVSFASGHRGISWADYQTQELIHLTPQAG